MAKKRRAKGEAQASPSPDLCVNGQPHDYVPVFPGERSYTADGKGYVEYCIVCINKPGCKSTKRFDLPPGEIGPITK